MKLKMFLALLGAVGVLWGGLFGAVKWAERSMNNNHVPPPNRAPAGRVDLEPPHELPDLWDVPSFSFTDQDGKTVTEKSFRGRVWVCDFIFTQCVTACPIMTSKMLLLQKHVHQPGVKFVSFSVDPQHDTPAVLKDYVKLWQGDETRWRLLSTDPTGLAALVAGMKITVEATADPENPILHSSLFFLVDAAGHVRGMYDSVDSNATEQLAVDAATLAGGSSVTEPENKASTDLSTDRLSAVERGEKTYRSMGCLACHSQPRVAPPLVSLFNSQVRLSDRKTVWADEAYLHESIVNPNAKVVSGYAASMPSYRDQIDDGQIGDLIAYIKSLSQNPPGGHGLASNTATGDSEELLKTDPVCKMKVHVDASSPQATWNGTTFYFCSDQCREKFQQHPKNYPLPLQGHP